MRGMALSCALAAALLASCAPPAAKGPGPVVEPPVTRSLDVSDLRVEAEKHGAVRVIARIAPPPGAAAVEPLAYRATALAQMQSMGVTMAAPLGTSRPLVVAEVTAAQLDEMAASPMVSEIALDRLARPSLAQSVPLIEGPQLWALGGRGAGQRVAILDTGVAADHPFLKGRVTAEACFSTASAVFGSRSTCPNGQSEMIGAGAAKPCAAEGCDHGAHVAGIAAGRGEKFSGVAPDAEIVGVQVFSLFEDRARGPSPCRDSGQSSPCVASFTSDQIRALDHLLALNAEKPIAAANMSLGGGRSTRACDAEPIKPVIDQLLAAGVATVIAAGNDGFSDAVSFPGCVSTAVTVGATSKTDALAPFSNRGPQVDLLAPGVAITSSVLDGRFAALSGTSMAAPHVAGALAGLRSARPDVGLAAATEALAKTGKPVGGRPRIALAAAAAALTPPTKEAPSVTPAAADGLAAQIAAVEALPADQPVRVIVRFGPPATAEAMQAAAKAAGASVQALGGQPMMAVEAKPAAILALAKTPGVVSVTPERLATPQ